MRKATLILTTLTITLHLVAAEYGDVTDCALQCVADVSGTNCTKSNWPCLCANGPWVDQLNSCVMKSCNTTEQETTFQAVAEICNIFNVPLTASAEAMFPASALSANASHSLSAIGGPGPVSVTSMPPVTTMETSATPTSRTASITAGNTASSTGTASVTATPSAANFAVNTKEADRWFAMAVLVLAGAAIL